MAYYASDLKTEWLTPNITRWPVPCMISTHASQTRTPSRPSSRSHARGHCVHEQLQGQPSSLVHSVNTLQSNSVARASCARCVRRAGCSSLLSASGVCDLSELALAVLHCCRRGREHRRITGTLGWPKAQDMPILDVSVLWWEA